MLRLYYFSTKQRCHNNRKKQLLLEVQPSQGALFCFVLVFFPAGWFSASLAGEKSALFILSEVTHTLIYLCRPA